MENIFVQLYPAVIVIGLFGFAPQIIKMIRVRESADGLSLISWLVWLGGWCISFGYGATWLQDVMFCLVAGMNLIAHAIIVGLILRRRWEVGKLSAVVPAASPVAVEAAVAVPVLVPVENRGRL